MRFRIEYFPGDAPDDQLGLPHEQIESIKLQNFLPLTKARLELDSGNASVVLTILVGEWLFSLTRGMNHVLGLSVGEYREWMLVDACEFVIVRNEDRFFVHDPADVGTHKVMTLSELAALQGFLRNEWQCAAERIYGNGVQIEDMPVLQFEWRGGADD